jgi:glycosyltransferase involved in cell wall biosynthesis
LLIRGALQSAADERPLRILYILTSLGVGGAEKQVIDLATRMAGKGHSVALLVLKHSEEEWHTKLPVMRLNMARSLMGLWRSLGFARNFLVLFRPDILHSHTFPANIFTRLLRAMLIFNPNRPRVINTIHNIYEGGLHRMLAYSATDPFAVRVTAVSAPVAERFTHLRAVSSSKMSVLSNGIDTEEFAPDRNRRKRTRAALHAGDSFVWLAVGRLVPAKDYPNLIRAFAQVRLQHTSAILWIAGEGDRALLDSCFHDREQLGRVAFLGLRRDVVDLLDAADGFVLPSAWEGMPLAMGEAMAMEKLVVATDVGGVRELAGTTGSIVPAKDSEALAQAMLAAMAMNEWERKSAEREGRKRIQLEFSMPAKAEEWEQLYKQVLAEKPA